MIVMESDGTAPRNQIADDLINEITTFARAVGVRDDEMATAMLIGAYRLAAGTIRADAWADALEKGAAICRAADTSKRMQ